MGGEGAERAEGRKGVEERAGKRGKRIHRDRFVSFFFSNVNEEQASAMAKSTPRFAAALRSAESVSSLGARDQDRPIGFVGWSNRNSVPLGASEEAERRDEDARASDRQKQETMRRASPKNSKSKKKKTLSLTARKIKTVPGPCQALRPHPRARRARHARQRRGQGLCVPVRRQVLRRPHLRR